MAKVINISSDYTLSQSDDEITLLVDASGSTVNIYLPYAVEMRRFEIKRVDNQLTDIILHPKGNDKIENEQASFSLVGDFSPATIISSGESDWWRLSEEISEGDIETIHFQQLFKLSDVREATAGITSSAAMSYFGWLNITRNTIISHGHLHRILSGTDGHTVFELWKGDFQGPNTLIGSASLAASAGNFATALITFTGGIENRRLQKGKYLFCQCIEKETGSSRGFTFDVHFTGSR